MRLGVGVAGGTNGVLQGACVSRLASFTFGAEPPGVPTGTSVTAPVLWKYGEFSLIFSFKINYSENKVCGTPLRLVTELLIKGFSAQGSDTMHREIGVRERVFIDKDYGPKMSLNGLWEDGLLTTQGRVRQTAPKDPLLLQ